jgi:hypothetical protein
MTFQTWRAASQRITDVVFSYWFMAACIVATGLRLVTLSPHIDGPHEWRQCDTASYALNFFRDGINLMTPGINWLGAHKTLILEFPLPEAVVAIVYHVFWPSLVFDRLVYLAFFAGSAIYLYQIIRLFHDRFVAQVATAIFCFLPLSLFYSRAIHIDFAAVFFAHAFVFHAVVGYRERNIWHLVLTFAAATAAFLIKIPYAFYLVLPVAMVVLGRFNLRWAFATAAAIGAAILLFALWRLHVEAINAQIPDLSFLPKWYPFIDRGWWYYGTIAQRLDFQTWKNLLYYWPVANMVSEPGLWFVAWGVVLSLVSRRYTTSAKLFFLAWAVGVGLNVLIFFNLHLIMNYYQIPLLAFWAYYIAITVDFVRTYSRLAAVGICVAQCALLTYIAETKFFWPNPDMAAVGQIVRAATPPGSLVIAVDPGADTYDFPCALYHADRLGWSVNPDWLNQDIIARLKAQGATHMELRTTQATADALHDCTFCGTPVVKRQPTVGGSIVSVFKLQPGP